MIRTVLPRLALGFLLGLALVCPLRGQAQIAGASGDTTTLRTGVRYITTRPGSGERPQPGQRATIHYSAKLPDGRIFDTSRTSNKPLHFAVGRGDVIPGLDAVVALMHVGQQTTIYIPAAQAYGPVGQLDGSGEADSYIVPPNTDLTFEVELLSVR